jgi:hypothetical protein
VDDAKNRLVGSSEGASNDVVYIARCPDHGLHGERDECFICGGPVEKVPMVEVVVDNDPVANTLREESRRLIRANNRWLAQFKERVLGR